MKICIYAAFFFSLCNLGVQAQIVSNDHVVLRSDADFGDIQFDFFVPAGDESPTLFHSLYLNEPGLDVETFTIGSEFILFGANEGDFLTADNLDSFPSISTETLSFGDSFVGFAIREPVEDADWHSIGWIELSRDAEGLEMLGNAVSHSELQIGPAPGITVGVPEPSSATAFLLLLGFSLAACRRKR